MVADRPKHCTALPRLRQYLGGPDQIEQVENPATAAVLHNVSHLRRPTATVNYLVRDLQRLDRDVSGDLARLQILRRLHTDVDDF